MRQIVLGLRLDNGLTSAGAVLDHIEALTPAERRDLIDGARSALGLQSIELIDAGERIRLASRPFPLVMCHAPGCSNVPIRDGGVLSTPRVKRWFCPARIDQAEPGDMEPQGFGVRYSENGVIVPEDPVEQLKRQMREQMLTALGANTDTNTNDRVPKSLSSLSHDALREKAERTAREHAPVVIASFEC